MNADDQRQVIMQREIAAQRQTAQASGQAPLPFPAQREIVHQTKQQIADHHGRAQLNAVLSKERGQGQAKHPFFPHRHQEQIQDPAQSRCCQPTFYVPGVGRKHRKERRADAEITERVAQQAGQGGCQ